MCIDRLNKCKCNKQQLAADKPSTGSKRKVHKSWIVERKYIGPDYQSFLVIFFGNNRKFKKCRSYATENGAKQALEAAKSGFFKEEYFEFRIIFVGTTRRNND